MSRAICDECDEGREVVQDGRCDRCRKRWDRRWAKRDEQYINVESRLYGIAIHDPLYALWHAEDELANTTNILTRYASRGRIGSATVERMLARERGFVAGLREALIQFRRRALDT